MGVGVWVAVAVGVRVAVGDGARVAVAVGVIVKERTTGGSGSEGWTQAARDRDRAATEPVKASANACPARFLIFRMPQRNENATLNALLLC